VDEAYLQLSVRQHGEPFAEVGDDAVAQRGDEDGAGVADEYRLQNLIFPVAVYPVKGGGHHGAEEHVRGVQDVENRFGVGRHRIEVTAGDDDDHEDDAAQCADGSERDVVR